MCRWVVQKQFLRYIIRERALCRQPTWKRTSGWWRRTLRVVVGCRELLDGGRSVECGGLVAGGRAGANVDDTRRLRVSIWRRRTKIHRGDPRLRGLVAQRAGTSSVLARAPLSVLLTRTGGDDHFAFSCRTHIATSELNGRGAKPAAFVRPELSMGLFCVTRSNPAHQLTDPSQPNPQQERKFGPNPTQPNTTNIITLLLLLIGFRWTTYQIGRKIKFNCLEQPNNI